MPCFPPAPVHGRSFQERVYAVTVDADDRIIFGGFATSDASAADFTLWCYDATDGELDASFGDGGVTQTDFSGSNVLQSLAIDSRGRIVVGGYFWGTTDDFMVARYLADGQLDPSFGGGDGIVVESLTASQDYAYAAAIGPGDCAYAAGHATIDSEAIFAIVRLNPDGTLTTSTTQYVYSPRYIDAVICRDVADGATLVEGSRLYYTSDANHNVTALLSAAGDVVERTVYTPYGQAQIYAGNWSETYETSVYDNTHLYTGRVYDGAIDLYNFRARWYDAGVGQFIGRDPMGYEAGDVNLYRYVGSRPLRLVDPLGLGYREDFVDATPDMPKEWQVHHFGQQQPDIAKRLLNEAGINVQDLSNLRGMPRELHEEVNAFQTKWWNAKINNEYRGNRQLAYKKVPIEEITGMMDAVQDVYGPVMIKSGATKADIARVCNAMASPTFDSIDRASRINRTLKKAGVVLGALGMFAVVWENAKLMRNIAAPPPHVQAALDGFLEQYSIAYDEVLRVGYLSKGRWVFLEEALSGYMSAAGFNSAVKKSIIGAMELKGTQLP